MKLYNGDCLEVMKSIPDKSIDAIITDPPYGTTACKWDSIIPFKPMWEQLNRIIKPNGAIVLFGSEPFSSVLRMSNIENYKYDWYWNKLHGANFMNGNRQPIKNIELASVFYKKQPPYNSQKTTNPKGVEKRSLYKPSKQKEFGKDQVGTREKRTKPSKQYEPNKLLAKCLIEFKRESKPIHPTQKPIALMEYLIKTYTNELETVLDFTMGSGTTGVACCNLNRDFIGIELDKEYFKIAEQRIKNEL
tara:strand:- start:224 stop:964 length:741 start_codon:yes stop_codon:yes gene_type:complete